MANGTEAGKLVNVRHKREFRFAFNTQKEIAGLGRTRARKSLGAPNGGIGDTTAIKKFKQSSPIYRDEDLVDVLIVESDAINIDDITHTIVIEELNEVGDNSYAEKLNEAGGNSDAEKLNESGGNIDAEKLNEAGGNSDVEKLHETGIVNDAVEPNDSGDENEKDRKQEKLVIESEEELESDVVDVASDDDKVHPAASLEKQEQRKHQINDNAATPLPQTSTGDVGELANIETAPPTEEQSGADSREALPPPMAEGTTTPVIRSAVNMVEGSIDTPVQENTDARAVNRASPLVISEVSKSKNVQLKTAPTKLKELLETELLEGLNVRYVRGFKSKAPLNVGLCGVIRGSGILCFCDLCEGKEVISPIQFELHAGSANKRPPDYIFLENYNSLRDVLNACKDSSLVSLEETVRKATGCSSEKKSYCINCKGPLQESGMGRKMLLCDLCVLRESHESRTVKVATPSRSPKISNPRSSDSMLKLSSSSCKAQGKITRKDLRLHKLVFECDILPDGTELGYYAHGELLLSGHKIGNGILCYCCRKEVSPSQFEAHAGCASRRKPYLNIFTSNGLSLHELSLKLTKSRKLSLDESDDLCSICRDGGDLLCCDGCPRAFHKECIPLSTVPDDTWYCKYCEKLFDKEKLVECNANAIAAGRIPGVDPIEQITQRCIRIVKDLDRHEGGCVFCRSPGFSKEFGPRTVMICDQCEKEYHVGCLRDHGVADLKGVPNGDWFCSEDCNGMHSSLQLLTENGEVELSHSLVDLINKKNLEKGVGGKNRSLIWRLLNGKMQSVDEIRLLLAKAVSIFHEQFDPIYYGNAKQDLIPHLVYGRRIKDRELRGMHCAVLMVDSIVVSAGVIRIFNKELAELPLIATSSRCQGLGYFQALYSCVEILLSDLGVKNLLLPAAGEAKSLWTKKFGFLDVTEDELNDVRKYYDVMVFDGTTMLRKEVPPKN